MKKIKNNLVFILSISLSILYNMQLIKAQSPTNVNNTTYTSGMHIFTDPNTIVSPSDNSTVNFSGTAQVEYQPGALVHLQPGFSVTGLSGNGYFHGVPTPVMNGKTCDSAKNFTKRSDGIIPLEKQLIINQWYKFNPTDTVSKITIINFLNGSGDKLNKVKIYEGKCDSLTLVAVDSSISAIDSIFTFNNINLISGKLYYLEFSKSLSTDTTLYVINFTYKIPLTTPCPVADAGCLVWNGDFENYSTAPNDQNQIGLACGWNNATAATPDYYNLNVSAGPNNAYCKVPLNRMGNQNSYLSGNGYAGFYGWGGAANGGGTQNWHEYICQLLKHPLIPGVVYTGSMYVSLAEESTDATNHIGMYFSTNPTCNTCYSLLPGNPTPQVISTGYVGVSPLFAGHSDATTWFQIANNFSVTSVSQWLTIGDFANSTQSALPASGSNGPVEAYYYVDHVTVVPASFTISASTVPICGNSVTITNPPTTYLTWYSSVSGTTFSSSASGSTTATVPLGTLGTVTFYAVLTQYPSCQLTSNTISVNFSPIPTLTVNSPTICAGQTATITATGSPLNGTYSWSTGSSGAIITDNPTTTTTYTCSYALNGCSATATSTVTANPLPPVPAITGDQSACTAIAAIPYTITNVQSPISGYNISVTNGAVTTPLTTNGNFAVTWNSTAVSSGGSFIVSYTNSYGCVSTVTIPVSPCCINGGNTIVIDNGSASTLTTLYGNFATSSGGIVTVSNKNFSINGIFTVDQDLSIIDCNIVLGTNAKINVNPGETLTIGESHLRACNMMWAGIYEYNSLSKVSVNGSVIEDAKIAVYANAGGQYHLFNSVFNKNYEGLVVNSNVSNLAANTVNGCVFTCRNLTFSGNSTGGILPGYNCNLYSPAIMNNASPAYPTNAKSFLGIDALNSSTLTFGDGTASGDISTTYNAIPINVSNVFDYLDNGINANNSNVNIYNNLFENILQNPPPTTYCLYCPQPPPSGNGILTSQNPSPYFKSITVGGNSAYQPNVFYNNTIGINSSSFNNTILYNKFNGIYSYGISISNGATLTNDIENNNMIHINGGIYCFNIGNTVSTTIINNNFNIGSPPNRSFITNFGIYIGNASLTNTNLSITNNTIDYPSFGIYLSMVQGGTGLAREVENNTINFYSVSSNPEAGIKAVNCSSLDISDNTIAYAWAAPAITALRGIYLQATPNSTVFRDTLNNMGTGIYAFSDCHVSKLECNTFNSCSNGFVFNGATIGNQLPLITTRSTGNKWNGMTNTTYITGAITPNAGPTPPNWYWDNSLGAVTTPIFSLMPTLSYVQTSANNCSQRMFLAKTNERELNVGNIVRGQNKYDTLSTQYLQNDSTFAFHYLKSNNSLLQLPTEDSSVYNSFINAVAPMNLGKFEMVNKFLSDSLMANTLEAAKVNQSIKVQSAIQDNKKTVNNLLLNKVNYEQDTANIYGLKYQFSTEDTATLMNIALQNPFFAGDAVYTARVLLFMDVDDDMGNSDRRRLYINPPKDEQVQPDFKIYPNPNSGTMQLSYTLNANENGFVTITNLLGENIAMYKLVSGATLLNINESELESGIYFYQVYKNNQKVYSDKIIISK